MLWNNYVIDFDRLIAADWRLLSCKFVIVLFLKTAKFDVCDVKPLGVL